MFINETKESSFIEEKVFEVLFPATFPNWKNLAVLLLAGLLALLVSACGVSNAASKHENEHNEKQTKIIQTQIIEATTREAPKFIAATGSFEAFESAEVAPETSGKVAAVLVNEGDFIKHGEIIIRLDEREAQLRLEQARAAREQAAAQLNQAEAQYKQAQAALGLDTGGNFSAENVPEVRQARAAVRSAESDLQLAEANERRFAALLATGDTSKLVYDQRRNEAEKMRAALNEARERLQAAENAARRGNQGIEASRAAVTNARAALESAQSNVALAQKSVADAVVRAPFSGFVSARPVAAGEFVSPNTPVATIVRTSPVKLRLQIPETEAGRIRIGMSVSATVAAFADRNFAGRITAINPLLSENARSLQVEAVFENGENLLRPGMFATAQVLQHEGETGIYIPRAALVADKITNSAAVFIIENDTARLRVVQPDEKAAPESNEVRIFSGVDAGEKIAGGNLDQLFDGAKVLQ